MENIQNMKKILKLELLFLLLIPIFVQANSLQNVEKILLDPVTLFFIVVISGTTIFFLFIKYDRYAITHGPEILTTLGIFGCFIGIALALLDFDTNNINQSVQNLLNGVKTAFWASVFGILGSLLIKFKHRFFKEPILINEDNVKTASLEDVVDSINNLRKSIASDNDSSLLSQIKLMRQEQLDNSNRLIKSLDDFASKVSELGSKALIEALEKVIKDFNTQLNEQFGENFKHLNSAVEKLVLWQQQYKEELDKLQDVQIQSAASLWESARHFGVVVEKADAYTASAENLSKLVSAFNDQYGLMKQSQESLYQVLVEMKKVEPSFSQKIIDLTDVFKNGTNTISTEVQNQVKEFSTQIKQNNEELSNLVKKSIPEIQKQVNDMILESQKQLNTNFATLDKNLEEELQKSLRTLGQQLASLSEKFVSDYTPLTDRLKDLINISKGS
jgi:DNA anti-recombination protein RmuC